MNHSSRSRGRLVTLAIAALSLVAVLAACSSSATPTPSPTPSPTPTPTPEPYPFTTALDSESTFEDVVGLLPTGTTECLRTEMGDRAYEQFLQQTIYESSLSFAEDIPSHCFEKEALIGLFVAGLWQAADGLSASTVTCLRETFQDLDEASLARLADGELSGASDSLGIGVGLLLCLTDEEAERITAESFLGELGADINLTLADVRCVLQRVDVTQLMQMFEGIDTGTQQPTLGEITGLLEAFSECGVDLNELMEQGSMNDGTNEEVLGDTGSTDFDLSNFDFSQIDQLPPDLQDGIRCLIDAVGGEENARGFLEETYTPAFDQLIAASQCEIDPSQFQ